MQMTIRLLRYLAIAILLLAIGCSSETTTVVELKSYPINTMEGILTGTGTALDATVSSDGRSSLRIEADKPQTVRLYETGDIDIEGARLLYQAKLRTKDVTGQVYIEMWCHFAGRGEFFSRALQSPVSGTTDWASQETPFFLKHGENPDNIRLNVVINGTGTVWVDDIRLTKGPLQ